MENPARIKQSIGLDIAPSWAVVSEHDIDERPHGGLSPLPDQPDSCSYGFVPSGLFAQIKARSLELAGAKKSRAVRR